MGDKQRKRNVISASNGLDEGISPGDAMTMVA